jgi:hypothetical protein
MAGVITVADAKALAVVGTITAKTKAALALRNWCLDHGLDPDDPKAMRATVPMIRRHLRKPGLVNGRTVWDAITGYNVELANRLALQTTATANVTTAKATADAVPVGDKAKAKEAKASVAKADKELATATAALPIGHTAKSSRESIAATAVKSAGLTVATGPRSKKTNAKDEAMALIRRAVGQCYAANVKPADIAKAIASASADEKRAAYELDMAGFLIARRTFLVDSDASLRDMLPRCVPGLAEELAAATVTQ